MMALIFTLFNGVHNLYDVINYLVLQNVNININNMYIIWSFRHLYPGYDIELIKDYVIKNQIVIKYCDISEIDISLVYEYIIYSNFYQECREMFKHFYENNLLILDEIEILNVFYYDFELLKYFDNVGYVVVHKPQHIKKLSKYLSDKELLQKCIDYFGDSFDNIFPEHIVLYRYLLEDNYDLVSEILNKNNLQYDNIRNINNNISVDKNNISICLYINYMVSNNYLLNFYFLDKIIESEIIERYKIIQYIKQIIKSNSYLLNISYYYLKNNVLEILKKIDFDFFIENNVVDDILCIFLDYDWLIKIYNHLDDDYNFGYVFLICIRNGFHSQYKKIYELLDQKRQIEYYNKMLDLYIGYEYDITYLISKYVPEIIISTNIICGLLIYGHNEFVIKILQNKNFTQSELDQLLTCSRNYDISMMLLDLGAKFVDENIIDILIVYN